MEPLCYTRAYLLGVQTFMVEMNATTAVAAWAAKNFARALCFLVDFYFVTARIEGEIC